METSRGARALHKSTPSISDEKTALSQTIQSLETWFRSPRWNTTTRPYSASEVASLRNSPVNNGLANYDSFSNRQAKKLWTLLSSLNAVGGYSHTFGALDTVQVVQMAPHLTSVYISGWQCR